MSDEKIDSGDGEPATPRQDGDAGGPPTGDDRDTNTNPPQVTGGQPAVGDDRPRNTEF